MLEEGLRINVVRMFTEWDYNGNIMGYNMIE
jgi:hypothetical protein